MFYFISTFRGDFKKRKNIIKKNVEARVAPCTKEKGHSVSFAQAQALFSLFGVEQRINLARTIINKKILFRARALPSLLTLFHV